MDLFKKIFPTREKAQQFVDFINVLAQNDFSEWRHKFCVKEDVGEVCQDCLDGSSFNKEENRCNVCGGSNISSCSYVSWVEIVQDGVFLRKSAEEQFMTLVLQKWAERQDR